MNEILNVVTAKIKALDNVCVGTDTKITFEDDHTNVVEIPVAPTDVARALLRALLVEIGRHEQEVVESQVRIFETAADSKG